MLSSDRNVNSKKKLTEVLAQVNLKDDTLSALGVLEAALAEDTSLHVFLGDEKNTSPVRKQVHDTYTALIEKTVSELTSLSRHLYVNIVRAPEAFEIQVSDEEIIKASGVTVTVDPKASDAEKTKIYTAALSPIDPKERQKIREKLYFKKLGALLKSLNDNDTAVINSINTLSAIVIRDILHKKSHVESTLAIERWIAILKRCFDLGDIHTAMVLFGALHCPEVQKLKTTLSGLSAQAKEIFASMEASFIKPAFVFATMKSRKPGEYIPVYFQFKNSLAIIEEARSTELTKVDEMLGDLKTTMQAQKKLDTLHNDTKLTHLQTTVLKGDAYTENEGKQHIERLEPKGSQLTPCTFFTHPGLKHFTIPHGSSVQITASAAAAPVDNARLERNRKAAADMISAVEKKIRKILEENKAGKRTNELQDLLTVLRKEKNPDEQTRNLTVLAAEIEKLIAEFDRNRAKITELVARLKKISEELTPKRGVVGSVLSRITNPKQVELQTLVNKFLKIYEDENLHGQIKTLLEWKAKEENPLLSSDRSFSSISSISNSGSTISVAGSATGTSTPDTSRSSTPSLPMSPASARPRPKSVMIRENIDHGQPTTSNIAASESRIAVAAPVPVAGKTAPSINHGQPTTANVLESQTVAAVTAAGKPAPSSEDRQKAKETSAAKSSPRKSGKDDKEKEHKHRHSHRRHLSLSATDSKKLEQTKSLLAAAASDADKKLKVKPLDLSSPKAAVGKNTVVAAPLTESRSKVKPLELSAGKPAADKEKSARTDGGSSRYGSVRESSSKRRSLSSLDFQALNKKDKPESQQSGTERRLKRLSVDLSARQKVGEHETVASARQTGSLRKPVTIRRGNSVLDLKHSTIRADKPATQVEKNKGPVPGSKSTTSVATPAVSLTPAVSAAPVSTAAGNKESSAVSSRAPMERNISVSQIRASFAAKIKEIEEDVARSHTGITPRTPTDRTGTPTNRNVTPTRINASTTPTRPRGSSSAREQLAPLTAVPRHSSAMDRKSLTLRIPKTLSAGEPSRHLTPGRTDSQLHIESSPRPAKPASHVQPHAPTPSRNNSLRNVGMFGAAHLPVTGSPRANGSSPRQAGSTTRPLTPLKRVNSRLKNSSTTVPTAADNGNGNNVTDPKPEVPKL